MVVDLKKFKKRVEKKLPILFIVEEAKMTGHGLWTDVAPVIVSQVIEKCKTLNIHSELAIITYGREWTFRFPVLKADSAPYFKGIENLNSAEVSKIVSDRPAASQTFLGSALNLTKAILDDPETVLPDRYKPAVVIVSNRNPARGWEASFEALVNEGRSSKAQFYWITGKMDQDPLASSVANFAALLKEMSGVSVFSTSSSSSSKSKDVCKSKKVTYLEGLIGSKDPETIADTIVRDFKLEPLDDETSSVEPVDFDAPGFEGSFGDGTSAKGDGVV